MWGKGRVVLYLLAWKIKRNFKFLFIFNSNTQQKVITSLNLNLAIRVVTSCRAIKVWEKLQA